MISAIMGTLFKRADGGGAAGNWYAEYTDHSGTRVKRSTKTRNKTLAQKILAKWEESANQRRTGLVDPRAERLQHQTARALQQHFDEWVASLEAKGNSPKYIDDCKCRWNAIVAATEWTNLADVSPESLESFCGTIKKLGRSARTIGQYVQTARGFVKWCIKTGRINHDPLIAVSKPNPELDRRLIRRILLPDEWPHLVATAASCSCYGVTAIDRPMLYAVAIQTGYRSEELRALAVHNLGTDGKQAWLTLRADQTKNKLPAKQFITLDLHRRLVEFIQATDRHGADGLFTMCNTGNISRMIASDLEQARQAWIDESKKDKQKRKQREASDFLRRVNFANEKFDFHSLRHTCGAWLAMQGVHPKTIQSVMRHSTIKLTLDTYGHLMPGAETSAIDLIGDLQKW